MNLNFTRVGNNYVSEFEAVGDFNIHIERDDSGYLFVNQRTTSAGAYDSVKGANFNYHDPVVDMDFTGLIYPKYIQVVSKVMPTNAVVTFASDVQAAIDETITTTLNTPV